MIGVLGFLLLFFFDLTSLKRVPMLKLGFLVTGNCLIGTAIVSACFDSEHIALPNYAHCCGWCICPLFFLLLIYSLFFEIPFRKTYISKGSCDLLITTGTYGLVWHPGVLWFILFLAGLFLITGSKRLLICLTVMSILDVLYAVIQEKLFFVRIFGNDYREYQKLVPMFIPDASSLKRCVSTFIKFAPSRETETS